MGPELQAGSHSNNKISTSNNKNSTHYLLFTMGQGGMSRPSRTLFQLIIPGSLSSTMCACSVTSHSAIPGTVAHQAPLSMGFPRQEYWSGLPFPPPGDLPDPGIKPASPALHVDSSPRSHLGRPVKGYSYFQFRYKAAEKQTS